MTDTSVLNILLDLGDLKRFRYLNLNYCLWNLFVFSPERRDLLVPGAIHNGSSIVIRNFTFEKEEKGISSVASSVKCELNAITHIRCST